MMPDVTPLVATNVSIDTELVPSPPPHPPVFAPVVATTDAKRVAGTILEVLAGVRSITDAALGLGVTPARYYALEARAVAGLIAACEPRSPGPQTGHGLQAEVDRLRAERDRLRDEAARYQALARIAQTAFGPPSGQTAAPTNTAVLPGLTVRQQRAARAAARTAPLSSATAAAKPRKKRIPTVRALRLARQVQHGAASPAASGAATPPSPAGG
jgi:hypothetical protein